MNFTKGLNIAFILFLVFSCRAADQNKIFIRLNQVGFLPNDIKTAVVISKKPIQSNEFFIRNILDNEKVYEILLPKNFFSYGNFNYCLEIDFSKFQNEGKYYLEIDNQKSYVFQIGENIFNSVRDSVSLFFKVQRCGPTNPLLHEPCHLSDVAFILGQSDSSIIDVTGGWHDAGDYLKFFSTAAYTTYLLLFSYEFDQNKFNYDLDNNQVPDILEEARVGLDWLLRCRFKEDLFVTQVQDISDHRVGWRLPENDTLRYNRPGYAGIGKNQIGIFTAVMSLASRIWSERFYDYEFANKLLKSATEVYSLINTVPDIDNTQSGYYQDFDHWGKLSLGAIELFLSTKEKKYYDDAINYADSAKSDFWWSWGNMNSLAYYKIAKYDSNYISRIKRNLDYNKTQSSQSLFREAADYTWGSTNSFLGAALQAILYKEVTGKNDYDSLMIFQRDYILGRNPWGISFMYNVGTTFSKNLHSQIGYLNNGYLPGALSSGPSPAEILEKYPIERTNTSTNLFNTDSVKYFDDFNDFITNEPTIGNNATALFVFGFFSKGN